MNSSRPDREDQPYTSEQVREMDDRTDYARLDAMTDEEKERNAIDDPDAQPTDGTFWANTLLKLPEPPKVPVHIRLSPGVLEYFRKSGPGYQTRINQVLEAYVAHQKDHPRAR